MKKIISKNIPHVLILFVFCFRKKISRVSPEVVDIPNVETVVEISGTKDTEVSGETSADDNKDAAPPQGRLPPLQPLKVLHSNTCS